MFWCWLSASGSILAQDTPSDPGHWHRLKQTRSVSLRGVSVANRDVVWASGADGTVLRSVDRGQTITTILVPGAETSDFRDVHAFDAEHASLMAAGQPARMYWTENGGKNWSIAYECADKRSFFNAMAFWDQNRGIAFSDPIDGRLLIISTRDGGKSWQPLDRAKRPVTARGEHGYAASGTCLTVDRRGRVWIGLGGPGTGNAMARVFASGDFGRTWSVSASNLVGTESAGIFSIFFIDQKHGIAVGGDYKNPNGTSDVVSLTHDGAKTWSRPDNHGLRGYRSCVAGATTPDGEILIACGPSGCDWSRDAGHHWHPMGNDAFHALAFSMDGTTGYAVGADGRLARWVWRDP
ncbi:MAG: hypothetical protein QGG09_19210 [Pirellulaceae bacterium]|nr:hypothetical protein [Pirellulaceae bacterium]HJN11416.1 hypothetical protein [Pirellulaceae bacterium]